MITESAADSENIGTGEKGGRIAPIQLGLTNQDTLRRIMGAFDSRFAGHDYRWQQLKAHSLPRIYAKNAETKNEMTEWLIRNGVEFNSYTEKDNKHRPRTHARR